MQISWQSMKSINTFDHLMKSGPVYQTSVKATENLININEIGGGQIVNKC